MTRFTTTLFLALGGLMSGGGAFAQSTFKQDDWSAQAIFAPPGSTNQTVFVSVSNQSFENKSRTFESKGSNSHLFVSVFPFGGFCSFPLTPKTVSISTAGASIDVNCPGFGPVRLTWTPDGAASRFETTSRSQNERRTDKVESVRAIVSGYAGPYPVGVVLSGTLFNRNSVGEFR